MAGKVCDQQLMIDFLSINGLTQCTVCQSSIFCSKTTILEKLEKSLTFIFVSKLTIFSVKKFEMHLNFCALIDEKLSIRGFIFGNFVSKS